MYHIDQNYKLIKWDNEHLSHIGQIGWTSVNISQRL